MFEVKRSKYKYIIAILGVLVLLAYVLLKINSNLDNKDKENELNIEQNVKAVTQTIDSKTGYAESRICVIAHNISMSMLTPELHNPKYVLSFYAENSPFSFIEFVRADGINVLANGTALNASDRVYYREGMKGKSGVWANFTPALSKEVLLNYYSPVYYKNEIVGVLTGVVGGNFGFKSILRQDFFDELCYSVLCDSKGRIVTGNFEYSLGQKLDDFLQTKGLRKTECETIYKEMAKHSTKTFKLEHGSSYILVSFAEVKNLGCYVLQIVPDTTISSLRYSSLVSYYGIIIALFLLLIIIGIAYTDDDKIYKALQDAKKELKMSTAISRMYYTVHIIDMITDEAEEYICPESIRALTDQKQKASEKISFVIENLSKTEWKEQTLSFVDLSTLQERMKDQNSISLDFESVNVWVRAIFTVMERDEQGAICKIIFITRVIDKYMKEMQMLHRKSNVDQLTGLLNRRAYEDNIKEHENVPLPKNFVLASIDINGLKDVNDQLGHAAGDEMLKGAAVCLEHCLGSYGSVYRIGGDEFIVMLFVDSAKLEAIKKDLDNAVRAWHGNLVHELHLACGYASKGQYPDADLQQLTKLADAFMYDDKEHYYSQEGLDRRRKQHVFDAICSSYTKILRVNLSKDSYTIIRLDEEERKKPDRPNTISGWLESFGHSPSIHPDDSKKFLEATKLEELRAFFKEKQNRYSLYYRRDIHGEFKYVVMEILAATDYTDEQQIVYLLVKDVGSNNL